MGVGRIVFTVGKVLVGPEGRTAITQVLTAVALAGHMAVQVTYTESPGQVSVSTPEGGTC